MRLPSNLWCLVVIVCSYVVTQSKATPRSHLPKVDRLSRYEPLDYDPAPLREKHERIARGIIYEPQIRNLLLRFSAYSRDFRVHLRPSRSTAGVRFLVDGKPTNSYDPATFYEGEVEGDKTSHVSGHVIDGVFSGVIKTQQGIYHVEKSKNFFRDRRDVSFHSFIYHEGDVELSTLPATCGVNSTVLQQMSNLQSSAVPVREVRQSGIHQHRMTTMAKLFENNSRRKRAFTSTGGNFCHMRVAVDHRFYEEIGGGDETDTFAEVVSIFNLVQDIYQMTDFDDDNNPDFITPSIQEFNVLRETDPGYRFGANFISVNDFLDLWSQEDHTDFCLALLFTNLDFNDGVLGLAWVAQPPGGNRGGICEDRVRLSVGERSLNTAIVTYTNFGRRQPRGVSVVTVAHEIGHNFGSPHDPTTSQCSPGGSGGNFIMFPRATNGQQSNNNQFSPCSRRDILDVLDSSKSNCFSTEAFCGNGILEEGEQCDQDPCCDNDICMLSPGNQCSSQQACCDNNCRIMQAGFECREETDCADSSMCNGTSGTCPPSTPRVNELCNDGNNVCDDMGNCVGSYCLRFQLTECQCSASNGFSQDRFCDVCCVSNDGTCQSTFDLARNNEVVGIEGRSLEPGRSCNNFNGYCSQQNDDMRSECIFVDNEQTLDDLLDLLNVETFNEIIAWLTVHWWIAIIIIFAILGVFILLQITYRRRKPLKKHLSRARNSLRGQRGGGQPGRQNAERSRGRRQRDQGRRQISSDDAVRRLCTFFPTSDQSTVRDIVAQSSSESKAVRRMLELGYPMKKIPIPQP